MTASSMAASTWARAWRAIGGVVHEGVAQGSGEAQLRACALEGGGDEARIDRREGRDGGDGRGAVAWGRAGVAVRAQALQARGQRDWRSTYAVQVAVWQAESVALEAVLVPAVARRGPTTRVRAVGESRVAPRPGARLSAKAIALGMTSVVGMVKRAGKSVGVSRPRGSRAKGTRQARSVGGGRGARRTVPARARCWWAEAPGVVVAAVGTLAAICGEKAGLCGESRMVPWSMVRTGPCNMENVVVFCGEKARVDSEVGVDGVSSMVRSRGSGLLFC